MKNLLYIYVNNINPSFKFQFYCFFLYRSIKLKQQPPWKDIRCIYAYSCCSRHHPTKELLYGHLPPISLKIRRARLRFVGYC